MPEPAIQISGLFKSYGDVHALCGVDMTIDQGEFFGMLGPNGAGKTTTINILTGLVFNDRGSTQVLAEIRLQTIDLPGPRSALPPRRFP